MGRSPKGKFIVVTMGDPAGVGPEIILKAANRIGRYCVIAGNAEVLNFYKEKIGVSIKIDAFSEDRIDVLKPSADALNVINVDDECSKKVAVGKIKKEYGEAAYRYIKKAVDLCLSGKAVAMVTAPINKASLNLAGHHFAGHTELLKKLTSTPNVVMMLQGGKLRIALATTHLAVKDVPKKIKKGHLLQTIEIISKTLRSYEGKMPRIGVCALNPHAGDGGIFGNEEQEEIIPAIKSAKRKGIKAVGPISADTIFKKAVDGEFDVVLAMYHDQGMGPLKLHSFGKGVNITLGLPILRTSVDHGTAFDIAGKGVADESSLVEAVRLARKWSKKNN